MTLSELKIALAAMPSCLEREVAVALDGVAEATALEAGRLLEQSAVAPSPPGAPPGLRSGSLAAAVSTERLFDGSSAVVVGVPYGADLEFGTTRMAARPFLRPAVANTSETARTMLSAAFERAVATARDTTA